MKGFKKYNHPYRRWYITKKEDEACELKQIFAKRECFDSLRDAQINFNYLTDLSIIAVKITRIRAHRSLVS